jgi:hypothetical protein
VPSVPLSGGARLGTTWHADQPHNRMHVLPYQPRFFRRKKPRTSTSWSKTSINQEKKKCSHLGENNEMDGAAVVVARPAPARIARPPTWRHGWPAAAHTGGPAPRPRSTTCRRVGGAVRPTGRRNRKVRARVGPLAKASLARAAGRRPAAGPLGFRVNPVSSESETETEHDDRTNR